MRQRGRLGVALGALALWLAATAAPAERAPEASPRPEMRPVLSFTPPAGATPAPRPNALPTTSAPTTPAPTTLAPTTAETTTAPTQTAAHTVAEQIPAGSLRAVAAAPRPVPRPGGLSVRAAAAVAPAPVAAAPDPTPRSAPDPTPIAAAATAPRPEDRPRGLGALFQRTAQPQPPRRGSVCGNRAIRGVEIAPIQGARRGCGIAAPVRVTEVAGVRLSTPATIDCPTALALNTWMEQGASPAIGRTGGGLVAVQVAAHYACRTRNNRPGARISEHGRGRAIDISAFVLANGERITVLHGWRSRSSRAALRQMHEAACGPFGTVLGPNSDRFHQDHFHFDTARYRSGPYCR